MTKFKGVLFDFDGTLAKTMEDNYAGWLHAFSDMGISFPPEALYELEGMKVTEMVRLLSNKELSPAEATSLVQKKDQYYLSHNRFALYEGVETLITKLATSGIPIGIVTAAMSTRFYASVPPDFCRLFKTIVTGEMLPVGKPSPEPYLIGAEKIEVPPAECIVVENAPMGVKAAKSAGCFAIGITSTLSASALSEADIVVPTFADLLEIPLIKSLLIEGEVLPVKKVI